MCPTSIRNMTVPPQPSPDWWLGFHNSLSKVGFSDRGSYVQQHLLEAVHDQPKSPEATSLPSHTNSARLEICYLGNNISLPQRLSGKSWLSLDPYPPHVRSCTAHAHVKSPQLSTLTLHISLSEVLFLSRCYDLWFLPLILTLAVSSFSAEDTANISGCSSEKIFKVNSLLLS